MRMLNNESIEFGHVAENDDEEINLFHRLV